MNIKLLISVVLVLIGTNFFNVQQVFAQELDPNMLWVADSSIGRIDGFAVHPNGNIFAYFLSKIYEIDGSNGKLLRNFTIPNKSISSIDISGDGKYLATAYDGVIITDLITLKSDTVGYGNLATFNSSSTKIAYAAISYPPDSKGHDSSIVILNLETQLRSYIKTEEMITKIAFSPDGHFFATGGSGQDVFGKSYVSLKLWDANTLKLIKELEKFPERSDNLRKIQFSYDSKSVAFWSNIGIYIFDTQNLLEIKKFNKLTFGSDISGFTWIDNNNFIILSKSITFCRLTDDWRKVIYQFPDWGYEIETDFINNRLITRTGYPYLGGYLISWDLNKILSSVETKSENTIIQASYQKGTLTISGFQSISSSINIEIFDINGKLVRQFDLQSNGSEFTTPLKLPNGTYLMNLKDGNNVYSGKFLVVE